MLYCTGTIHQPSQGIFESFDELLLLKRGGMTIFNGPLGHHASALIDALESVSPKVCDDRGSTLRLTRVY